MPVGNPPDDAALDDCVARALEAEGMHSGFLRIVRTYVLDRRDQWRVCCGSNCDPCMLQLGRVVDRVRLAMPGIG